MENSKSYLRRIHDEAISWIAGIFVNDWRKSVVKAVILITVFTALFIWGSKEAFGDQAVVIIGAVFGFSVSLLFFYIVGLITAPSRLQAVAVEKIIEQGKTIDDLKEEVRPQLSARLKPGEMLGEDSVNSRSIIKVHRIILKNEGLEPIKRGNLKYTKTHLSGGRKISVRIEPENKFVKQTEDGDLSRRRHINPKKVQFQLNRGEEISFDGFTTAEYWMERNGVCPQLTYLGIAEDAGLKERLCHLTEEKTYSIGFRATSDTGGALDFTVKLRLEDFNKPIKVWKAK